MRHRLYLHVVWTTRDREPSLDAACADFLERFLPAIARQERALVLAFGVVTTHVHVAVRTEPATDLPRLLQRWKGGSAVVAVREGVVPAGRIRWAKGYNVETVSVRAVGQVIDYVRHQARRHPALAIPGWQPKRVGR